MTDDKTPTNGEGEITEPTPTAPTPTLLDSFAELSKETGIGLSVMINHYHDGTVEFNIEHDTKLYTDGVPLRVVVGLMTHAVNLIIKQSKDEPDATAEVTP